MKKSKFFILTSIFCIILIISCVYAGCGKEETNNSIHYSFSVSTTDITMKVGEEKKVYAVYGKEDVSFKIDDEKIAVVDEEGNITAKGLGITYLTISATNTDEIVKCTVNVVASAVYEIQFNNEFENIKIYVDASVLLSVRNICNGEVYNSKTTWSANSGAVILQPQSDTSCRFKATVAGTYTITVTNEEGVSQTVTIVVDNQNA